MRKLITTVFFIAIATFVYAQDWKPYKNLELAFSADYPDNPVVSTQNVSTAFGDLDMHMVMLDHSANASSSNVVYAVAYSAYPEEEFKESTKESNDATLEGAVNGAVNNVRGELLVKNDTNLNGFPGKVGKIEISGAYIYLRVYLVENIIYFCQVICFADKDGNKDIDRFLDSFELIKTK